MTTTKQKNKTRNKKKTIKVQQFAEQMDQLRGTEYREEEVGASGKDIEREVRKTEDGGLTLT